MDNKQPPPYGSVVGYPTGPPYPHEPQNTAPPYPADPMTAPYPMHSGPNFSSHPSYTPNYSPPQYAGPASPPPENQFTANPFAEKSIRNGFIKKVYLILTAQLLVTCAFICLFLLSDSVKTWVRRNSWFYYISYGIFLCTYIALVCCPGVRRRYPGNFIALSIFTLAFSYMTATITSFYNVSSVLIAVGITAAVCFGVSLFAIQTRIDFTKCSALLFILSLVVLLTGLACTIVYVVSGPNRVLQAVYGGLGALLFALYLAFDTQMIIGGRKHEMSPEEYIYGALQLYLDVVYLFMMLLSLFGSRD